MRLTFLFSFILMIFTCANAVAKANPGNSDLTHAIEQLKTEIKAISSTHQLPSVQLELSYNSQPLVQFTSGYASVEQSTEVTPDTIFRVGSISKTVTAIAVMQLVEQEHLGLYSPIADIIPEITIDNPWYVSHPVTVIHLLEHTAGFDDLHFMEHAVNGSSFSTRQALELHPDTRTVRYPPGQFMSYSNLGATLLAYIIEKVSDLSFEDYVQSKIFEPLGMHHSSFFMPESYFDFASGYILNEKPYSPVPYQHLKDRAGGALNSTAKDLSKLQQLLQGNNTATAAILSASSIEQMQTVETTLAARSGYQKGYGKFLIVTPSNGGDWIGHSGRMNGYLAEMWHHPASLAGYVYAINASGELAEQANQQIALLVQRFISTHLTPSIKEGSTPAKTFKPSVKLDSIEGHYRPYTSRLALFSFLEAMESFSRVYQEAGKLMMQTSHATYELTHSGHNVFSTTLTNGETVDIIFINNNGNWYYQIPRLYINAVKTTPVIKYASLALILLFVLTFLCNLVLLAYSKFTGWLGKGRTQLTSIKWLLLASMSLFSVFIALGSAGASGMIFVVLGQTSIQAIAILLGLLIFACCSLRAAYSYLTTDLKAKHTDNGLLPLFITGMSVLTQITVLAVLWYLDFIFVATWLH